MNIIYIVEYNVYVLFGVVRVLCIHVYLEDGGLSNESCWRARSGTKSYACLTMAAVAATANGIPMHHQPRVLAHTKATTTQRKNEIKAMIASVHNAPQKIPDARTARPVSHSLQRITECQNAGGTCQG